MLTSKLSLLLFSSLLFVGLGFTTPKAKADCPDGTIFVGDGTFECNWAPDGSFGCGAGGTCENSCGEATCVYANDRIAKVAKKDDPIPTVARVLVPNFIK